MKACKLSLSALLIISFLCGCGGVSIGWGPAFPRGEDPGNGTISSTEPSDPRARASLQLTQQGKIFLAQGKLDDAISVLERAVGLDPTNGQNYYYLAEAWILKNNLGQAGEFNRLAGIYLEDDYLWMRRVREQKEWLDTLK